MGPYELLRKIIETLEGLQIPYLVTGSVAVMAYGEPRMTTTSGQKGLLFSTTKGIIAV